MGRRVTIELSNEDFEKLTSMAEAKNRTRYSIIKEAVLDIIST